LHRIDRAKFDVAGYHVLKPFSLLILKGLTIKRISQLHYMLYALWTPPILFFYGKKILG